MVWDDFVALLPDIKPPEEKQEHDRSRKSAAGSASSSNTPGWLQEHQERMAGKKTKHDLLENSSSTPHLEAEPLTDEQLEDMWHELEQQRELWVDLDDYDSEFFRISLSGGAWLKQTSGRDFDVFKGQSRGEEPRKFATKYIGQYSA
eukprot:208922-Karenia_brevis.AAC.1